MTRGGGSGSADPRLEFIEHLRFLREIGVRELRAPTWPTPASSPGPRPIAAAQPGDRHPVAIPSSSGGAAASASGAGVADPRAQAVGIGSAAIAPAPTRAADPARAAALAKLREEEIGDCRRCRLCEKRTNIVFGVGSPDARLMFVGEGPGADEDVQGIPFVGRAGQLLTDIIGAMKMKRDEVYIANIVKCRPPENRTPEPDEIALCRGFLEKQIGIIEPEVIVCLGAVAVGALLGATGGITKIRGTLREYKGIPVMPTFHPAYLLRSPDKKRDVWQDMQKVMALLAPGTEPG